MGRHQTRAGVPNGGVSPCSAGTARCDTARCTCRTTIIACPMKLLRLRLAISRLAGGRRGPDSPAGSPRCGCCDMSSPPPPPPWRSCDSGSCWAEGGRGSAPRRSPAHDAAEAQGQAVGKVVDYLDLHPDLISASESRAQAQGMLGSCIRGDVHSAWISQAGWRLSSRRWS